MLAGAAFGLAPSARADGERAAPGAPADPLERLTGEERAFLAKRIPGWNDLDEARRRHIAQNVIRLRDLTPEDRARFRERVKRVTKAPRGEASDGRLGRLERDGTRILATRGVGSLARAELGLDAEAALLERGVSSVAFDIAFSRLFLLRVVGQVLAEREPPAPDTLPAGTPPEARARYAEAHARWQAALDDEEKRQLGQRLGLRVVMAEAEWLRRSLSPTDMGSGDAYALALGRRLREKWPRAFDESLAWVRSEPDRFLEMVERDEAQRAVEVLGRARGALGRDETRLLVALLDRFATHHRDAAPERLARLDDALRAAWTDGLRLPAEAWDRLPPRSEPKEREEALAKALRLPGPRPDARGRFGWRKPPGVSDEAWARRLQELRERRKGGK